MCLETIDSPRRRYKEPVTCWKVVALTPRGRPRTPFCLVRPKGFPLFKKWTTDKEKGMIREWPNPPYPKGFHAWVNRRSAVSELRAMRTGNWNVWTSDGLTLAKVALKGIHTTGMQHRKRALVGKSIKILEVEEKS